MAQRPGHAQTNTTHIYVHALEARDAVAAGLMGDDTLDTSLRRGEAD